MISTRLTHRVAGYGLLVVIGLAAALVSGRPEPALLATPFAVFLASALVAEPPRPPAARLVATSLRVVEGDDTTFDIVLDDATAEVAPLLPADVELVESEVTDRGLTLTVSFPRWGVFDIGRFAVRSFDDDRAWVTTAILHAPLKVRVHPRPEHVARSLVPAVDLQPFVGQHPSRARGDGFEFADLRPYRIGDRAGAVNWRATARRGAMWVNERHPDRTTDVVVLLDTFGVDRADRRQTLDAAVHLIAAVAEAYARVHDRIGLLTFGGHLRWIQPAGGSRQVVRIVDALLDTESLLTDTWAGVQRVPIGAIPPRSLLLAVTPLDSDTAVSTLLDLRARGFDIAVVMTPPSATADDGGPARVLGRRLDALLQDTRRLQLERLGIAVSVLRVSLAASLQELTETRRRVPVVRR